MTQYYGNQGGGGFDLRFIIGIIIAIAGVVMYFSKTTINPTTGEKQRVAMTPEQETTLGLQSAPEMARQMGGEVPPSDPEAQEVQVIGNRVWHNSDAARSPYQYRYHLLADPRTVNAFALPGGQVFITKGLLDKLSTESELAGVLGHETGHVVERHSSQQMAKSQLGQMLVTATGVAASGRRNGYSGAVVASAVNQMTQLRFSREDETQADTCGLRYMAQAGYDPRAMLGVMKVLQEVTNQQGGRPPEMLVTHPYPEHRVETINGWLKQNFPNGVPSTLSNPPLPWIGRSLPGRSTTGARRTPAGQDRDTW